MEAASISYGVVGIAAKMPKDEAGLSKVIDEMNQLTKISGKD